MSYNHISKNNKKTENVKKPYRNIRENKRYGRAALNSESIDFVVVNNGR